MKKILVIFIFLFMVCLMGCQQDQEDTNNQIEDNDIQGEDKGRIIEDNLYAIIIVDFEKQESMYLNPETFSPEKNTQNIVKENGYILIPICEIAEAFGYSVNWENEDSLVINGKEITSPIPLDPEEDPVLAPLTVVEDSLGLSIETMEKDNGDLLIWISQYPLLTDQDVEVTDDYLRSESEIYFDLYELQPNGATYRGITIGSSRQEVQNAYGVPFATYVDIGELFYFGKMLPDSEASQWLAFSFENDELSIVLMGNSFY